MKNRGTSRLNHRISAENFFSSRLGRAGSQPKSRPKGGAEKSPRSGHTQLESRPNGTSAVEVGSDCE